MPKTESDLFIGLPASSDTREITEAALSMLNGIKVVEARTGKNYGYLYVQGKYGSFGISPHFIVSTEAEYLGYLKRAGLAKPVVFPRSLKQEVNPENVSKEVENHKGLNFRGAILRDRKGSDFFVFDLPADAKRVLFEHMANVWGHLKGYAMLTEIFSQNKRPDAKIALHYDGAFQVESDRRYHTKTIMDACFEVLSDLNMKPRVFTEPLLRRHGFSNDIILATHSGGWHSLATQSIQSE